MTAVAATIKNVCVPHKHTSKHDTTHKLVVVVAGVAAAAATTATFSGVVVH